MCWLIGIQALSPWIEPTRPPCVSLTFIAAEFFAFRPSGMCVCVCVPEMPELVD